jgi:hypothetical protein
MHRGRAALVASRWLSAACLHLLKGLDDRPASGTQLQPIEEGSQVLHRDGVRIAVIAEMVEDHDDPSAAMALGLRDVGLRSLSVIQSFTESGVLMW